MVFLYNTLHCSICYKLHHQQVLILVFWTSAKAIDFIIKQNSYLVHLIFFYFSFCFANKCVNANAMAEHFSLIILLMFFFMRHKQTFIRFNLKNHFDNWNKSDTSERMLNIDISRSVGEFARLSIRLTLHSQTQLLALLQPILEYWRGGTKNVDFLRVVVIFAAAMDSMQFWMLYLCSREQNF